MSVGRSRRVDERGRRRCGSGSRGATARRALVVWSRAVRGAGAAAGANTTRGRPSGGPRAIRCSGTRARALALLRQVALDHAHRRGLDALRPPGELVVLHRGSGRPLAGLGFTRRPPTARPAAARCGWAAPRSHKRRVRPRCLDGRATQAAPGQALWRRVKSEVNILEVFPGRLSLFWLVPRTSRPPGAARRRMRAPNLSALACAKLRAGGASQRRPYGGVRAASHG